MRLLAVIFGIALIALVAQDGFETIILPRRVTRRIRLAVLFYRTTRFGWISLAHLMRSSARRDSFLGYIGPLSLLALLLFWAVLFVLGFLPISNSEDRYGPSCVRVPACGLSPPLWRFFGVLTGSNFGLPPHEEGPSTSCSNVSSSPAAQTIVPPVDSAPLSRRLEDQRLYLCVPGLR